MNWVFSIGEMIMYLQKYNSENGIYIQYFKKYLKHPLHFIFCKIRNYEDSVHTLTNLL